MSDVTIRRAILSVSDKSGLVDFARQLVQHDVQLFSTGGTSRTLREAGIPVDDIADYTGFPEMMNGRVKTLHPKIFGGILARRDLPDHMQALTEHEMLPLDLVVVNLYPFEATIAKPDVTEPEAIEQIDIGGPSLIRAAAKNFESVVIATDPSQYAAIGAELDTQGRITRNLRRRLATHAFRHTAAYDAVICTHLATTDTDSSPEEGSATFPDRMVLGATRHATLRYGENPHQAAAAYHVASTERGVLQGTQLHGKELSYNNLLDLDSAWNIAIGLSAAGVAVIKHNNPCGAASDPRVAQATRKAMAGDPVSAFGSILGIHGTVDAETAEVLSEPGLFIEAIAAVKFDPDAFEILTTRPKWKSNVRLLELGQPPAAHHAWEVRPLTGGWLVQQPDRGEDDPSEWKVVTQAQPDAALWEELKFAWQVVRYVKSNAIVITRDQAVCGVGAGQMSRVDSVEISLRKAGDRTQDSVLASDAFFPFDDSIHRAAECGVRAVIQPGGSKRDGEVIQACDKHGLAMLFTGKRHFRH